QQDDSVALRIDVSDQSRIPATPYWRMFVLDDYREGTFRLSTAARLTAFGAERTNSSLKGEARPHLGEAVYWTFYLEPGVSRYLPLLGQFSEIKFREAQNFRRAGQFNIVMLREEPVTMTAYRVEDFTAIGALPDPVFAQIWR